MTSLSSVKVAISAGALSGRGLNKRACSLIVSLALVTVLTIAHQPTLVASAESQNINTTTTTAATSTSTPTLTSTTTPPTSSSTISIKVTEPKQTIATAATTSPPPTTNQAAAAEPSTAREPTEQEINEARKIIQEVAYTIQGTNPHRLIMNKPAPQPSSLLVDYAPDSPEARVSDATTHFGLSLMRTTLKGNGTTTAADDSQQGSTVVSPLSLQMLLNIILLGTKDQSLSQAELAKVLGYGDEIGELSLKSGENEDTNKTSVRLGRPHEAMHSVVESIMKATHSPVVIERNMQQLLNTNPTIPTAAGTGSESSSQQQQQQRFEAHLQTTARNNETPLTSQVNFTLANLMLTNKDLVETNPDYESDLRRYYNIKVEQFSRQLDAQKKDSSSKQLKLHERVNNWVKNITQNQITDLADEASLSDEGLLLVLLNAAHFKGRWLHTFNSRLTQDRIFYNNGQSSAGTETKFMRQNGLFGYAEFNSAYGSNQQGGGSNHDEDVESILVETSESGGTAEPVKSGPEQSPMAPTIELSKEESRRLKLTAKLNCSVLSLPFSLNDGQEMSMVILLPSKRDGLDELIANLDVQALNEIYRSLTDQQVQAELPKFSIEASYDVKAMLTKLGLKRIFDDSAELDRMFATGPTKGKRQAKVDKIIHKAKIVVDEQGAEAAAASMATVVLRSSIRIKTPTFIADHPFLYVIRHNRSNMPLFMGQVRKF